MRKLAIIAALACIAYAMSGCAASITPAGVTTVTPDPATVTALLDAYNERHPIHRDK